MTDLRESQPETEPETPIEPELETSLDVETEADDEFEAELDAREALDEREADADDDDEFDDELELVVLDLAGTTVADAGLVEAAFLRATSRVAGEHADEDDREAELEIVRATMGRSKIEVFRLLTDDEDAARLANEEFERAYSELVHEHGIAEIPGAAAVIRELQDAGIDVVLTTGFSPATRDELIEALGWTGIVEHVLSPADAGRGRPAPDLPLTALLRTGAASVRSMVVVGDTASDIASGVVVGVLTGAHDAEELELAGADAILPDITALPVLLGLRDA